MALWGNNDNKFSGGTVSLNYGTRVVTGTGTTFGQVGAAATGDVIRFGTDPFGGATGYMGDAVIVSIAGTQSLKIQSIARRQPLRCQTMPCLTISGSWGFPLIFSVRSSPETLLRCCMSEKLI